MIGIPCTRLDKSSTNSLRAQSLLFPYVMTFSKRIFFLAAKETNRPSFDEKELESDEVQRVWQYLQLIKEEPELIQQFYYDPNVKRTSPAECLKTLIRFVACSVGKTAVVPEKSKRSILESLSSPFFHLGTVKPIFSWVLLKDQLSLSSYPSDSRNWLPCLQNNQTCIKRSNNDLAN